MVRHLRYVRAQERAVEIKGRGGEDAVAAVRGHVPGKSW